MVSNYSLLKRPWVFIGIVFSFLCPPVLICYLQRIFFIMYTGWRKRSFGLFEGELVGHIKIIGDGKRISIGKGTYIENGVEFQIITQANGKSFNPSIKIGNNCRINHDTQLSSTNSIIIGDNVGIAARTLIVDTVHGNFNMKSFTFNEGKDVPDVFLKNVFTREYYSKGPVVIEDNVHIAMNCVIMPGILIGHNSIIAANTVVDKNIPPYSIVSGNPCDIISY